MADENLKEFTDLTDDEKTALKRHWNAMDVSVDYVDPFFEKFIRLNELYHGHIPDELDGTFSKVMLRIPFSIVQNELPRSASALFSGQEFFDLHANDPLLESPADAATAWLNYTARERNRIFPRILSTLTRVGVMGTGYRIVTHTPITKYKPERKATGSFAGIPFGYKEVNKKVTEMGIVSQNVDIWNILPAPHGGVVNPLDLETEEGVPWVNWINYMTPTKLKSLKGKRGINDKQIDKMLDKGPQGATQGNHDIDREYRERARSSMIDEQQSDWVTDLRKSKKEGIEGQYRCVWTWFRDQWMLIGEGRYVLYLGPPMLDWFPLAKYVDTPDMENWYGIGLLEVCEDVLLSYLLNYNFRMDYLASTLHPTKFIRDDIIKDNGGNLADFDPEPYGVFQFSKKVDDIRKSVWYDRFPEISPQAFMEETSYKQLLQEISAQPNYMKGMGGAGTLANETATGIVSLIEEGTARSSLRALNLEYIGLHDELMLMLKWGKKYVWKDQEVRVTSKDGWPWMLVPHESIDDGYGIELKGTRSLVHKNEMVKRMLSLLPMLINNPNVPGQKELLNQVLGESDVFPNPDRFMNPPANQGALLPAGGQAPGQGGVPTAQNESQAVAGALPATGTPAGFTV